MVCPKTSTLNWTCRCLPGLAREIGVAGLLAVDGLHMTTALVLFCPKCCSVPAQCLLPCCMSPGAHIQSCEPFNQVL